MSEEAKELADKHGGLWGEHPGYPVADWMHLVSNDETRASYWDYVLAKLKWDFIQERVKEKS